MLHKKYNRTSAQGQELVEFVLILPIMIVILVSITELGFIWTLRGTVADSVKQSVQALQANSGVDVTAQKTMLETLIRNYLANHGVPNASSAVVNLLNLSNSTSLITVSYTYNPTFTLPNFFGIQVMPNALTMTSSQAVNSALLQLNSAGSFGVTPIAFTEATSILEDNLDDIDIRRGEVVFLLDGPNDNDRLINWWGKDLQPPNVAINAATGKIRVKTPYANLNGSGAGGGQTWRDVTDTRYDNYAAVISSMGYTTLYYVDVTNTIPAVSDVIFPSGSNARANPVDLEGSGLILTGPTLSGSWCSSGTNNGQCNGSLAGSVGNIVRSGIQEIAQGGYEVLTPFPFVSAVVDSANNISFPTLIDNTARYSFNSVDYYANKNADFVVLQNPNQKNLELFIDMDGDGIPALWDGHPLDPDADKNGVIDGYQSNTINAGDYEQYYTIEGTSFTNIDDIIIPGSSQASFPAPGTILVVDSDLRFMTATTSNPVAIANALLPNFKYFLEVVSVTQNGEDIKIHGDEWNSTEHYYQESNTSKILGVQVLSVDRDGNGMIDAADDVNVDGNITLTDAVSIGSIMYIPANFDTGVNRWFSNSQFTATSNVGKAAIIPVDQYIPIMTGPPNQYTSKVLPPYLPN